MCRAPHDETGSGTPVRYLHGVGPKRAEALERLGVRTIEDLLFFFPRRYEDRRRLSPLDELVPGEDAFIIAEVVSLNVSHGPSPSSALLTDGRSLLRAVWFSKRAMSALVPGTRAAFYGRVVDYGGLQLSSPEFELLADGEPTIVGKIFPVYPATASLPQRRIRALIDAALPHVDRLVDPLPTKIRDRHGMKGRAEAVVELHHPTDETSWIKARNRLAFDELFLLQVGLLLRRGRRGERGRAALSLIPGERSALFHRALPFSLTRAQERSIAEILRDMRGPSIMNRLLHGDVGSGKTLVAVAAILAAVDSGAQAALMVPTEILAQQHYMTIQGLLAPLGVRTALLTGSVKGRERRALLASLRAGDVGLLVGTHALASEGVAFARLGLTIVDEQHRFGVLQRNALIERAPAPHVLVMTATPIPRTLVLSVYGDLDVSTLDELPPGRRPIVTSRVDHHDEDRVLRHLKDRLREGRQAYWICPLIEEGEGKADLSTAVSRQATLARALPGVSVGLMHGRLPMDEKADVMRRFAAGEIALLVATVVVEVGLDVPNATTIVIEDAGRFGLAQLHQLRGRVGRGTAESLCVLIEGRGTTAEGRERITAMCATTDGFALAEADLRQRGPGEVCGARQHGATDFRVADLLRDQKILELARKEARALLAEDPTLAGEPLLRAELMARLGETLHIAGTA